MDDVSVFAGHIPTMISQAYLFVNGGWCVRVRRSFRAGAVRDQESSGHNTLAVKGPREDGARIEYPWEIPPEVAIELYRLAPYKLVKSRYQVVSAGQLWDIDRLWHENEGLVIAECETEKPNAHIVPPSWCLEEVTSERRYDNENLAKYPFRQWT